MPNAWERKEKLVRHLADIIRRKRKKRKDREALTVHEMVDKPLLKNHDDQDMVQEWTLTK